MNLMQINVYVRHTPEYKSHLCLLAHHFLFNNLVLFLDYFNCILIFNIDYKPV